MKTLVQAPVAAFLAVSASGQAFAGCANYVDGSLDGPAPHATICFGGSCEETTVEFAPMFMGPKRAPQTGGESTLTPIASPLLSAFSVPCASRNQTLPKLPVRETASPFRGDTCSLERSFYFWDWSRRWVAASFGAEVQSNDTSKSSILDEWPRRRTVRQLNQCPV